PRGWKFRGGSYIHSRARCLFDAEQAIPRRRETTEEATMAVRMRDELRVLGYDELELVVKSHIPLVLELSDPELGDLIKRAREMRKRARDIANRQRREMRK